MALSHRHERFAQELAKGFSASEAYVNAGYEQNDGNASRLKGNEKIKARVAELQARGAKRAEITIASLVEELEEARQAALMADTPQSSAAVTASMGKAKLLGLVVDKTENTVTVRDWLSDVN
jgi:phage terminase small subunit